MPERPPALLALLDAGVSLARRTASGRVALARFAPVVHADLLPHGLREPVRAELEAAYAAVVEPLDLRAVERALRSAWGRPHDKVLDELDPEPLAVTAAAQVHAGELDGELVAVKVARPGVAATIRSELALLDVLRPPLAAVFGAVDVAGALDELREAALDELDLEHEGDQQQRVRRALRRVEGLRVPAVHAGLSADNVLVTERLDGPTLAQTRAADPGAVAGALVEAHLTAWSDLGLVLTDPRPSHVILPADGGVGLVGAGVARPVPRERYAPAVGAFVALADPEADEFVAAVTELGVLSAATAREAHGVLRQILGELVSTGPARLDGPALARVAVRASERLGDLMRLAAQAQLQPADLAALRMLGQLSALLSRLEATEDWTALAAAASAV